MEIVELENLNNVPLMVVVDGLKLNDLKKLAEKRDELHTLSPSCIFSDICGRELLVFIPIMMTSEPSFSALS
jgi:hypothetical protein